MIAPMDQKKASPHSEMLFLIHWRNYTYLAEDIGAFGADFHKKYNQNVII